ncbi:hypothetical protein BBJ28_00002010 [Nothophytophthora sp. Chile5]|nr:hypothetical protein BBJ28_00002010 [Nothophytophthora sp. Chile5]
MSWRRRAAPHSSSSSARAERVERFHEALHFGRVDAARRLIFQDASLANARSAKSPRETSLMVAATSVTSNLKHVLILVNLLLAKGASLRTKDDRRWQALMCVCADGVCPAVVNCLLDWNQQSGQGALQWSDRDDEGNTALTLACSRGHGRLASYILDQLDPEDECGPNTPLRALSIAIESQDERCVLDLLRNRKLQWEVEENRGVEKLLVHGEWIQTQGQRRDVAVLKKEVSVSTCVSSAIRYEMVRAVQALHRINRQCVGHATWFALYTALETHKRGKTTRAQQLPRVHPGLAAIAEMHRRDSVWERMQLVFLIRCAPNRSREKQTRPTVNVLAKLPDVLFRIVAEFLKPRFDDAEEAQKERFKSVLVQSSW